ncbi:MAG TPA: hypothetical protein VGX02_10565 [Candidatus Eremiobacteraceae bacterium]|jgi:hypothetical protein|nr:hypothetical protein [Candidatus Eremiobacteraceae bacterium]
MRVPVLLSRFIALMALIAAAGAAPCNAADQRDASPPPVFVTGFALPNVVYYGNCGAAWPTVLTFRSDFTSDYSLRVTARYDYVSEDPRLPESTTLSVHLAQFTTVTYGASVDIESEAFAYLRGGSGTLRYRVTAIDALAAPSTGISGSIRVEYCGV